MAMNWLFPVSFDGIDTPDIDYKTRYDRTSAGLTEAPPTGVPGYAFISEAPADLLEVSPTGKSGFIADRSALPPAHILMLQRVATDPTAQMTKIRPAKLAALGMIDAGDLVYGTDKPTLTKHVGLVP